MAVQIPNVGTGVPADQTGDSPWLAMKKVAYNFSDQTNAASRLVGTAAGNVMEVGAFGLGGDSKGYTGGINGFVEYNRNNTGGMYFSSTAAVVEKNTGKALPEYSAYLTSNSIDGGFFAIGANVTSNEVFAIRGAVWSDTTSQALPLEYLSILHSKNTLKDANGFLRDSNSIAEAVVADATGNVAVNSIQAGIGAPKIAYKKLTGTTAINNGVPHGLDASKILSIIGSYLNGAVYWSLTPKWDATEIDTKAISSGYPYKLLITYEVD